ncbi:hypothetical protein TNCT_584771 [Trichonephila clavata]|uniref:Integrase zinc-binding domain-containing protein n=1 Tax=Trichonephila clavata TaxID=2740835 RepID=A0A8X6G877_TRICU|nr:hypothetical protein TNCT_584771 [Trichonephila clavata]
MGPKKTLERIKYSFFWEGLRADVKKLWESCRECQLTRSVMVNDGSPITPVARPELPFQDVLFVRNGKISHKGLILLLGGACKDLIPTPGNGLSIQGEPGNRKKKINRWDKNRLVLFFTNSNTPISKRTHTRLIPILVCLYSQNVQSPHILHWPECKLLTSRARSLSNGKRIFICNCSCFTSITLMKVTAMQPLQGCYGGRGSMDLWNYSSDMVSWVWSRYLNHEDMKQQTTADPSVLYIAFCKKTTP